MSTPNSQLPAPADSGAYRARQRSPAVATGGGGLQQSRPFGEFVARSSWADRSGEIWPSGRSRSNWRGGGGLAAIKECRLSRRILLIAPYRLASRLPDCYAPGAAARRRHRERRRHCRPRRRRRARQARAAGPGSDRGRLRDVRGRRGPDDRLVHADPGGSCTRRRRRRPPHLRRRQPRRRLRRVESRRARRSPRSCSTASSPENRKRAVQAAQAYLGRQGGDAELRRHLRHRPVAEAARAVHAQRRRGAPGAEPDGHGQQPGFNCAGDAAAARRRRVRRRRRPPTRRTAPRPARAPGMPARSAPRPATPGSRRCRPASCPASRQSSATSPATSPTDGLVAIVRTLGRLPGRKSVILFSEGLDDHDPVGAAVLWASSTPPTAPTSASTPSTPPACAP